jgi:hypothetical protein
MMDARIEEILRSPEQETAQSFEHAGNLETRIGSRKPRRERTAGRAGRIEACV